jgi:hypothetical protein
MYRVQNIHGAGIKIQRQKSMMGSRCGCSGGEILLGSPVSLAPNGAGIASFPNLSKLDIPKLKSKMKKISF